MTNKVITDLKFAQCPDTGRMVLFEKSIPVSAATLTALDQHAQGQAIPHLEVTGVETDWTQVQSEPMDASTPDKPKYATEEALDVALEAMNGLTDTVKKSIVSQAKAGQRLAEQLRGMSHETEDLTVRVDTIESSIVKVASKKKPVKKKIAKKDA